MIENKKVFLWAARFVFMGVFVVVSVGFVAWEANGLVNWKSMEGDNSKQISAKTSKAQVLTEKSLGEQEQAAKSEIKSADARPIIIRKYLEKYKSPLAPYSDLIFELSETYGFDYRWIVAIAQQESNLCKKIPEGSHNCWGYGINSKGTLKFESYELALKSYAEYLKRAYFDKGLNTPETIMKKYCPSSNGSWAYGVRQFMDEMENGNFLTDAK